MGHRGCGRTLHQAAAAGRLFFSEEKKGYRRDREKDAQSNVVSCGGCLASLNCTVSVGGRQMEDSRGEEMQESRFVKFRNLNIIRSPQTKVAVMLLKR